MNLTSRALSLAMDMAATRRAMPTALGTAELRDAFTGAMRERCLVLARATSATFVGNAQKAVQEMLKGDAGKGKLIARLSTLARTLGYVPSQGFPGDADKDIPAAEPGSIKDLSGYTRLKLVLDTEQALASGAIANMQANAPLQMALYPALKLVRVKSVRVERGSVNSGSPGWEIRWRKAGGPPLVDQGGGQVMIAPVNHIVWQRLGDSSLFDDGLDSVHEPYWFNSGAGREPVARGVCIQLGLMDQQGNWADDYAPGGHASKRAPAPPMPPAVVNAKQLPPAVRSALLDKVKAIRAQSSQRLAGKGAAA